MNPKRRFFFGHASSVGRNLLALVVALLVAMPVILFADQNVTRTFSLRSGWNAIWLDVEPTNTAMASVFSGVPLVSVWTFADRLSAVDFIENTSEPIWNR